MSVPQNDKIWYEEVEILNFIMNVVILHWKRESSNWAVGDLLGFCLTSSWTLEV